jgi:S-formylglutathione hydrolase FrmB
MALFHVNFFSNVLGLSVAMDVILPQPAPGTRRGEQKLPVLWLLHGLSDDHTIWQRRTSIERYVEPLNLAVVMPAVDRSFYTDMAQGNRYWSYISEELPALARSFFPLSARREDNFVAGLSMGGYGAFKLALRHPERYAAAASLSGALRHFDRDLVEDPDPTWHAEIANVFGDLASFATSEENVYHLAQQLAASGAPSPMLYQCCGVDDFLYADNLAFKQHAVTLGLPLTYEEGPGEHNWAYWDQQVQRVLAWLPLPPADNDEELLSL